MPAKKKKKNSTNKPMPGLVFNEVMFGELSSSAPATTQQHYRKKNSTPTSKKITVNSADLVHRIIVPDSPELKKRKKLMWSGVILCACLVVFFRLWSFAVGFSVFNWRTTPEQTLIDQSKTQWNTISATLENGQISQELNKQELKETLQNTLYNATHNTSPSTSSSHEQAPTVSPLP